MESISKQLILSPQSFHLIINQLQPSSWLDTIAFIFIAITIGSYLLYGIIWDKKDPYQYIFFQRPQQNDGTTYNQLQATKKITKKIEDDNKKVVVFWGSQSGTAERFANQLSKECQLRFHLNTMAANLSDYDPVSISQLPSNILVIFILSTYGEGDPSDNANGFLEWLNKPLDGCLSNIRYAAFGLGNSNYRYYNRVVDIVVELLNKHGATSLLIAGKADDATNSTTEDFLSWKDNLFQMFRRDLGLQEYPTEYQPTISVIDNHSLNSIDLHHGEPFQCRNNPKALATCSPINAITVKSSREIFMSKDRNCIHMELDLSENTEMHYKTGDHLAIWPINPDEAVGCILNILGLSERQNVPISLHQLHSNIQLNLPTPTTPAALFRYYLEICAPVSRDIAFGLASFAPTQKAKSYILNLVQNKQTYVDFLAQTHVTFGRLLELASSGQPWLALPLSFVIEALPIRHPRYYSISSSSVLSPRRPSITALVSIDSPLRSPMQKIHGVASNYLLALSQPSTVQNLTYDLNGPAQLLQGTKIFAHIRKSKFKLPIASSTPIIMIAAGTGLAPFRAFIAERVKLHSIGRQVGQMVLFFGCRHPEEDFIYREELERLKASLNPGMLRILTAFSRYSEEKIYVQSRVKEHGKELIKLIEEGAHLFICGRASMARDVGRKISETAQNLRGLNEYESKEWSEDLKRKGKWREDVWG